MDINQLREFTVFARHLNFSKAALALGIAQPTLSSHIAAMEMELGFKLVQRGKPLHITPAGKQFCVECERILASFGTAVETCKELAKKHVGQIAFETPITQGGILGLCERFLLHFQKEFPTISIRKHRSADMPLEDILRAGLADVGLILNPKISLNGIEANEVELLPLHSETLGPHYLWVDESHPLAKRDQIELADLKGCRFLFPSSIRYQGLECLGVLAETLVGVKVERVLWPGTYEECIMGIDAAEVMIVSDDDLREPAYGLVDGRVAVPLKGMKELVQPCFIFLKSNTNPAIESFRTFALR